MKTPNMECWMVLACLGLAGVVALPGTSGGAAVKTGLHPEVRVSEPTRLDWEFAASTFGPGSAKLPKDFSSQKQRYQLYVPAKYQAGKTWPLVLFISPSNEPLGWRSWQQACQQQGMFFCAPYDAGNNCPVGQRTRIVLDVLEDVRRHWSIDAEQTYIGGFSGGGRMACTIAFSLPEYFGGVIPVCGTNPLHHLPYLQHRVQDRLSVAFVTGAKDFNRKENEDYMFPWFQEIKIRSKLWVVPNMGHGVPSGAIVGEVHTWLAQDLKKRQADAKAHPPLPVFQGKVVTVEDQAAQHLESAGKELKKPERTWRGVAMLQGIKVRWGKTKAAAAADKVLETLLSDPEKADLIAKQGGEEQERSLTAQARGSERCGYLQQALQTWTILAKTQADTAVGKKAALEANRLRAILGKKPFLGLNFKDNTTSISYLLPDGPAHKAGLRVGDKVVKMGGKKIAGPQDVAQTLRQHKPGDKVKVQVRRSGKLRTLTVEIGNRPQ